MPRQWRLIALLALLAVGLACAPAARPTTPGAPVAAPATAQTEWERTVATARQEGSVVVYGPPGDLMRKNLSEGFRSAFPDISVEWSPFQGGEGATKLEAERRADVYAADILITGTTPVFNQLRPIGALDPIPPALMLPEVTDSRQWLDGRLEFSDRDGTLNLVFIAAVKSLLAYNPNEVKPEDVADLYQLLDPRWKGKIVISEPLPSGGGGTVTFRWLWHALGPEKATEFIHALKAQAGAVDRDQRRQIEWVARGRYPIQFGTDSTLLQEMKQEGLAAGVLAEFRDYGSYITPSYGSVMLINRAPHPNAAKVFLNWLLTKDGQTAYSQASMQPSRRLDVPTSHLQPELIPKPDGKYWRSYTEENATMEPELANLIREVFGR
jgi:iron(III) transport system substrate-binding protein